MNDAFGIERPDLIGKGIPTGLERAARAPYGKHSWYARERLEAHREGTVARNTGSPHVLSMRSNGQVARNRTRSRTGEPRPDSGVPRYPDSRAGMHAEVDDWTSQVARNEARRDRLGRQVGLRPRKPGELPSPGTRPG